MNWTMRDGTTIPISKMTDTHLANAIKMLERQEREATVATVFHGEMYERSDSLRDEGQMTDAIDKMIDCEEWLELLREEMEARA